MRVGTVAQLWRYPVKSMAGERLEAAAIAQGGIPGDRGWAIYDEMRGGISNAKRLPSLRACQPRYRSIPVAGEPPPTVEIGLPDGAIVGSDAPDASRRLSELIGRSVSLRSLGAAGSNAAPRISSTNDSEEVRRAMMGILPGEPEPDMSQFPAERLRSLRKGNFFDAFPIHLLTRTTLRTLAGLASESIWDERRFRPNLLLDAEEAEGYPELGWIGRRLRVRDAVLEIATGCLRCVMTTHAVDELPEDHRVMRTLVRRTGFIAGVYAEVVAEGTVHLGDHVELL